MNRITPDAISIKTYINETWPNFRVELEEYLRDILPQPRNKGLNHIWKYGSADVVVRKDEKIVAIFEPGGSAHFQDEKQMKNDRRKWKLCELNNIRCLRIANGVLDRLSKRQKRKLIGRYLFGLKEVKNGKKEG